MRSWLFIYSSITASLLFYCWSISLYISNSFTFVYFTPFFILVFYCLMNSFYSFAYLTIIFSFLIKRFYFFIIKKLPLHYFCSKYSHGHLNCSCSYYPDLLKSALSTVYLFISTESLLSSLDGYFIPKFSSGFVSAEVLMNTVFTCLGRCF